MARRARRRSHGEVARRFAANLRLAIGERGLRVAAQEAGVDHTTILAVFEGRAGPDLATIAKLERGFDVDLWPGRVDID
ncbi:helix-turn-helix domain-containing protein [Cryobacterium tepidiphilum]|uniref:XRE family transcriptional regulator n=1 Tax=Cryobacterium tepidiphilum TaxID=2486026 RepID=A0A3M8LN79_9MICO|nr:XRE family transcriptional regulator [Cryobacterium tepidiphilum]